MKPFWAQDVQNIIRGAFATRVVLPDGRVIMGHFNQESLLVENPEGAASQVQRTELTLWHTDIRGLRVGDIIRLEDPTTDKKPEYRITRIMPEGRGVITFVLSFSAPRSC